MMDEQERRFREQADRETRLEALLAPTEAQQEARYQRLNEFLRELKERTERSIAESAKRSDEASAQTRRESLALLKEEVARWRRHLLIGTLTLAALMLASLGVLLAIATWRAFT